MKRVVLLLGLAALVVGGVSAAAAPGHDYAAVALNVLPPGENGGVSFDRNTTDQATLYDGLTPLYDKVGNSDLKRWFKPETLGLGGLKAVRTEVLPRAGVRIQRDVWDVPHVNGKTQADVEYGAGWATAEDRGLLLGLIRGPARAAALDIPGIDPIGLALSGRTFVPSAQTEAFLAKQLDLLRAQGPLGRHFVTLLQAYTAGINAYYKKAGIPDRALHAERRDRRRGADRRPLRRQRRLGGEPLDAALGAPGQARRGEGAARCSTTSARPTTPRRPSRSRAASRRSSRRRRPSAA